MCICILPSCMYARAPHVSGAHRGQKVALDLLELELGMIVSHHMGAGDWTWVFKEQLALLNLIPEPSLQKVSNFYQIFSNFLWDRVSLLCMISWWGSQNVDQSRLELTKTCCLCLLCNGIKVFSSTPRGVEKHFPFLFWLIKIVEKHFISKPAIYL